jgi:hypothetical protein
MNATINSPKPTIFEILTKSPLKNIIIKPTVKVGTVNKKMDFFD